MKIIKAALLILFSTSLYAQTPGEISIVTKRIDSLYLKDQNTASIKPADSAFKAYQRIIRSNFSFVKSILDQYGFPGYNLFGKETSNKYWLLVQHSDFDLPFQKRALELMKQQVDNGNASGQSYAYLIDRISVNEGQLQIYGTQVLMSADTQVKPCIDLANLDQRRKSVGLGPIKEYLEKCNEAFYELNPDQKREKKN